MGVLALAFIGVIAGAAGTEILRASKPELIDKVEDSAKRFVDSLFSSKKK